MQLACDACFTFVAFKAVGDTEYDTPKFGGQAGARECFHGKEEGRGGRALFSKQNKVT